MTPAARKSFEFQAPDPRDVCPTCKRETEVFLVFCDGHTVEVHRCSDHGDVVPMRSAIVNGRHV